MSDDPRTIALLQRLDDRSVQTLTELAAVRVELRQMHAEQVQARAARAALEKRLEALEAESAERRGQVRAAQAIGAGGGVLGLLALARGLWDWITAGGGH